METGRPGDYYWNRESLSKTERVDRYGNIIPNTIKSQRNRWRAIRYKHHQQALNRAVTILHHLKAWWLKKHTLQDILKFQNVKLECLHSYIRILNENIRIWDRIKIIDQ